MCGVKLARTLLLAAVGFPVGILAGEKPLPTPMPPVQVRARGVEWGPRTWDWEGVAIVDDPVNRERLFLGGRVGGAPFGDIGSWALAEDGKTWRRMSFPSAVLDPLRERCLEVRNGFRRGVAAARNTHYAAMAPEERAEATRKGPAPQLRASWEEARRLVTALGFSTAPALGWEGGAAMRAWELVDEGRTVLLVVAGVAAKGYPPPLGLFAPYGRALDEAADSLGSSPGPRQDAAAAYDPESQCVVLFGGSHGDYLLSDTWVYDCPKKQWRQVWPKVAPVPRAMAAWAPKLAPGSFRWSAEKKRLVLSGGVTFLKRVEYQKGFEALPADEWEFDARAGEWSCAGDAAKLGVPPGTRLYRTVVPAYDPCWYDAAPPGDAKATAEWLAALKPNAWAEVPMPERSCPERDWGTATYDPDRDQIYRWTGGHCADPSNIVSTYHPAINRWSIGYVAEIYGKGMSFNGRPDCLNHTYLHMAYDPVTKCLVASTTAGTCVYDPDVRDWVASADQPYNHHIYETCAVSTPRGVVVWTPGFFGLFDAKERAWKPLPVQGKLPRSCTDGSALVHDPKREVLWMATYLGYQKPSGDIWRYDMKTGEVRAMAPAGQETIGKAKGFGQEIRECVYLPKLDLVLFNNFVAGRQAAYDPARNRWVLLGIQKAGNLGTVSIGLVYDTRRGLVWGMSSYKRIYVLRIDPATLAVSEEPAR